MAELNGAHMGGTGPTDVLAFPIDGLSAEGANGASPPGVVGDVVICPVVLRREARAQGKTETAHWAHLIVHGTLHLVGYDHAHDKEAARMERREIVVLKRLGFGNPYRRRPLAAGDRHG
jgi:probable rRNA maturation factor